jgi:hypothetical protein
VVQWLIVSVIVITCAMLAIRAFVRSIRKSFDPSREGAGDRSACGSCGGCGNGQANRIVQIVTLDTHTRSLRGAAIPDEETHPVSGKYR